MCSKSYQPPGYTIRVATRLDIAQIEGLIRLSAHELSAGDYTIEQVDSALLGVFGVDSQLIKDQTYFVIESQREMAACGGWSFRATLFGSDDNPQRDPRRLIPGQEAAKIRAFFVHPNHARQGLGRWLLDYCEEKAVEAGYDVAELGATIPGRRLYRACGYAGDAFVDHKMSTGLKLRVYPMRKVLRGS